MTKPQVLVLTYNIQPRLVYAPTPGETLTTDTHKTYVGTFVGRILTEVAAVVAERPDIDVESFRIFRSGCDASPSLVMTWVEPRKSLWNLTGRRFNDVVAVALRSLRSEFNIDPGSVMFQIRDGKIEDMH